MAQIIAAVGHEELIHAMLSKIPPAEEPLASAVYLRIRQDLQPKALQVSHLHAATGMVPSEVRKRLCKLCSRGRVAIVVGVLLILPRNERLHCCVACNLPTQRLNHPCIQKLQRRHWKFQAEVPGEKPRIGLAQNELGNNHGNLHDHLARRNPRKHVRETLQFTHWFS